MHQFVFSFEVGWRLCFSFMCPRNIRQWPKNNDANTYENANAKRDSIVQKRTEAWLTETLVDKRTEGEVEYDQRR